MNNLYCILLNKNLLSGVILVMPRIEEARTECVMRINY